MAARAPCRYATSSICLPRGCPDVLVRRSKRVREGENVTGVVGSNLGPTLSTVSIDAIRWISKNSRLEQRGRLMLLLRVNHQAVKRVGQKQRTRSMERSVKECNGGQDNDFACLWHEKLNEREGSAMQSCGFASEMTTLSPRCVASSSSSRLLTRPGLLKAIQQVVHSAVLLGKYAALQELVSKEEGTLKQAHHMVTQADCRHDRGLMDGRSS